ncbi:serine/threonine-protein kinase 11-interacting protein-like [Lytechinus pictus]|uniref:serine/threonine-protein kinase 11-interacting protein-like n=1 Tax=Lytechinus pictus TaxID=7653 RepID=UPI0030BA07E1
MASSSGNAVNVSSDPVARLADFLRRGKSDIKVLTGKSKLSLTTVYLSILNRCFATTHPTDDSTEVVDGGKKYDAESVKYLRDVLHRTLGLKLLHENATLKGAVDVSRFHALTVLEVKRVPVHFLVGLGSLRSQLRVLICSRCVHSLQMLLVGCGGDKADEQDWPVLHTLNLSHNYIDALDESLRFLPALKALDLSHNNIRHTRDYFESLPEIIHLNLSYNQLWRVPSLGEFIPSHLQTLILRGNNIESLSGVEYLEDLGTLDLAKNAIFDSSELFSLGYLHRLRKMHFDGNPFTFQSKWRLMIAKYLPPEAAQLVTFIDEVPLTRAEIQLVPRKSTVRPMRPEYLSDNFSASLRSDMSYDNLEESVDPEGGQKRRKQRVKRLSAKVRNASISEQSEDQKQRARKQLSDTGVKSSSSPRTTPGTDAKKEFEDIRQMHGKDWLLALHNPYEPLSKPPGHVRQSTEPRRSPTDAKLGDVNDDVGSRTNIQVDVHLEQEGYSAGRGPPMVVVEEAVERTSMPNEESTRVNPVDGVRGQVNGHVKGQEDEGVKQLSRESSEQIDLLMRQESQLQVRIKDGDLKEEEDDDKEEEDDGIDLCGPLLIRLNKSEPPVQLFVTIKEAFIEEKNLYGKVVQRLETKSLIGMTMSIEEMLDEFSNAPVELPVVKLSFDYINKERRKRDYVMEDMNTCEALIKVLEPIIVQNEASKTRIFLQCLKCMMTFPKEQAKKKVEKKPKKSGTWTSEEESGSDFESVSEVLTCPSCGSNLLLEVDDPRRSEVNTPVGSVASVDMAAMPMAASSPWKQKREADTIVVSPSNKPSNLIDPSVDIFSSNSSDLSYTKSASSTPSQLSPKKDRTKMNLSPAHGPRGQAIRDLMPSPSKDGSLTSSLSSQHSGTSSDFRLPDPSIKMEVTESSPVEELVNYTREKLTELLTTNKKGFRQSTEQPSSTSQRYSLCPTDGGSVSSMDASGPTTPVQQIITNPFDSQFKNSATKIGPSRTSPSQLLNGSANIPADESDGGGVVGASDESEVRTNGGSDDVFNPRVDHRYSEDDIVVLQNPEAAASSHNMEYRNVFHLQDGQHQDKDSVSVDAISVGRLDSNESDIAVISETDAQSSNSALALLRNSSLGNISATSDTVFENNHHGNVSNESSESPAQQRQQTSSSDDHRGLLSSNEHDVIYKSNSGAESASEVNGGGQWNVGGAHQPVIKRTVQSSPSHSINSAETSMLSMAEEDCCRVDHRLKLFFSMSVFGNEEEFTCLLKGTVFQLSKKQHFDGVVVVSTDSIYLMKITKEESENPSDWLVKRTQHPIKDLVRIHVGLGSQSVQFEFCSDGILYTVVIGDKKRIRQFAAVLMNLISTSAWKKKFKGVVWEHAQTFLNLTDEVFVPQATGDTSYEVDPQITVFITSQLKTRLETKQGTEMRVEPLGIVVTATDIYLVEENHFYPLALGKNKKSVKGQHQFVPKGHRKISDISGLELYGDSPTDVTISFFSEDTGEESQWNISTSSDASLDQLITAIKQPWKEMFGVNIQETLHPSIAIQDLT